MDIVTLFCDIDELCVEFEPVWRQHLLGTKQRERSTTLTKLSDAMRNVEEDAHVARSAPAGWLIQVGHEYYTGNGHSSFERWTPFSKFAKIYRRKGWAQKMATQLGGQIVAVVNKVDVSD